MKKSLRKDARTLCDALPECVVYAISSEDDKTTTDSYMREITSVVETYKKAGSDASWRYFTKSGIFRDAIGKIVREDDEMVEIEEEY